MGCSKRDRTIHYLAARLGGRTASPAAIRAAERHLAGCADCARLAEALRPAGGTLRAVLAAPAARGSGCPPPDTLSDYLRGGMARGARATLRAHMLACEACLRTSHFLRRSAATDTGQLGGWRGRVRRAGVPLAVALPGYALAVLALTGQVSLARPAPRQSPPPPLLAASVASSERPNPQLAQVSAAHPATPRAQRSDRARRPAARPERQGERVATRQNEPGPSVQSTPGASSEVLVSGIQLALSLRARRLPEETDRAVAEACRLVLANQQATAVRMLARYARSEPAEPLAVSGCLALLQLEDPNGSKEALRTLRECLARAETPDVTEDPTPIRFQVTDAIVATLTSESGREAEAESPPVQALILAGMMLDQPGQEAEARGFFSKAIRWLERDLEPVSPPAQPAF